MLEARIAALFQNSPLVRARDFVQAGIPMIVISRAVAAGKIKRLARGVYCRADYRQNENGDLALVARRAPDAIICLLSALSYHGITTQLPFEVWIAIPHKAWTPKLEYPSLRIVRYSGDVYAFGTMVAMIEGVPVRLTTIEKTIADCFKFRNKIGLDVALEALREAKAKGKLDRDELWACAKADRVANVLLPYLEALS
ncbi:MAG: type IV toxin-antitoxin system AbiEi family antitoxin domain-containing protein [Spirochaetaceae bacterium]|nr:type IV toxin-antitoxin system AbiEi family antitoxin domain-containing protein [Spirochaetaceae bacterium]